MKKTALTLILLCITSVATGGSDVWQTLFKEKLQEARQGNSDSQFDVASMYQNGRGVKPDLDKAIEWYKKSAAQNNSQAVSRLKLLEANKERFKKVMAQAEKGDAESQYKLGKMYTEGVGVSIDHVLATKSFENAANQGYAKAEYKLGLNYYEGTGVKRNSRTAYKWFSSAAEQNDPAAQYYLGKMYASGSGVKRNYTTSLEWFTKAVEGGFNQARAEMIDVSEKMKMKKAAREKQASPATKTTVAVKKKIPVAKVNRKKQKQTETKAVKTEIPEDTPEDATEFAIEDLMVASWNRDTKPVTYLPSSINNCRTERNDIVCYSDNQTRESGNNNIKFKTKSVMEDFSKDGSFKVTYRNLVLESIPIVTFESSMDDDEVGGEDDGAGSAYEVKSGWGKKHTLHCQLKDSGTVSCLKNNTHTFELISPHTLVSGK